MAIVEQFVRIGRTPTAVASAVVFFANGFMFANWFVRIPSVKDALAISKSELGVALLFLAVGGIIAMQIAGALITKLGSGRVAVMAGVFFVLVFSLAGFADSLAMLCVALFLAGFGNGAMDVAMNAQADAAEAAIHQRIMSFCHAMFSLGLALGSIPAGAIAAAEVPAGVHLLGVGAVLAIVIFIAGRFPSPDRVIEGPPPPAFALPRGPLLLFGLICFSGAIVEGGINDWIAVYVEDSLGHGPMAAATAFGTFAAAMFVARLMGDVISERFGSTFAVRYGLTLAAAGLALMATGNLPLVITGSAAVGLGIAGVFPAVFRAAGNLPGRPPGPSMAAAVTLGYTGFLFGPPAIGFLADTIGLGLALAALIPLCLMGAALANSLRAAD
ncbi:MAG: MFS transporter [Pseudomonadota bacterium]